MIPHYYLGIDIGTQGARCVLLSHQGEKIGETGETFPLSDRSREEQSPQLWWEVTLRLLKKLLAEARSQIDLQQVKAIAMTSTSGTVIPLGRDGEPLHDALMYSDQRSRDVAPQCIAAAEAYFGEELAYTGFNFSSGLCKMVWFVQQFPEKAALIESWVHAADYLSTQLSGVLGVSDETNTLKSGYDIFRRRWPEYLFEALPIQRKWLPRVVPAGTVIGRLEAALAEELGLSSEVLVAAGITDGGASQIAAGAVDPGEWNTTIGTTMVIKGVTENPVIDPLGRLYNHRHPEGFFMPGGAGNTGADWVSLDFGHEIEELSKGALAKIPTPHLAWPLRTEGERFPLIAPQARGFIPKGLSRQEQFLANMEGVAYLERYAYEMIEGLSHEKPNAIYTAGGGSKSDLWLTIRSNVLALPIYKMKEASGAVGAAILAASKTGFSTLREAAKAMNQPEKVVQPEEGLSKAYAPLYDSFLGELRKRGYLGE